MSPELKTFMVGLLLITCAVVTSLTLMALNPTDPVTVTSGLFLTMALFMPAELPEGLEW